jgi:hypothetical protein
MGRLVVAWPRLLVAFFVVTGGLLVQMSMASATTVTLTGNDTADAYVDAAHPTTNYGGATSLEASAAADVAYLRFSLSTVPSGVAVQGARIVLSGVTGTGSLTAYRLTSGKSWSENRITWNKQPGYTTAISAAAVPSSGTVTLTLNGFVTANGTYNVALVGTSGGGLDTFSSREAGTTVAPVLQVDVDESAPTNVSPPTISGTPTDGNILTVTHGTYTASPAPTYTEQWQRCTAGDTSGASCTNITGATGVTYTLTSNDVQLAVRVLETAQNTQGAATTPSTLTAQVQSAPPVNTVPPSITGQPAVGTTLSASTGTWTGTTPMTFTYQWLRCGTPCATISGATSSTYTVVSADNGTALEVTVKASNNYGQFSSATSSPTATVGTASSGDPVIAAAGDIACDPSSTNFNSGNGSSNACREKYTAALLNTSLAGILDLGDNQYYCGSLSAYQQSYGISWGTSALKAITHPSVGNHEYLTSGGTGCDSTNSGAAGYFSYFGSAAGTQGQGYYSFNIGSWHLIALNSNCSSAGGCSASSPQGQWLANDLKTHTNMCTLAFFHIPLYSSGGRASSNMQSPWTQLYNAGADVVLSGHDHIYERFAPQNASGQLDTAKGIREFIVGTGGANHTSIATVAANSEVRDTTTFGVLKLTLHPSSYDWSFVRDASGSGTFTDSGSTACH